VVTAEVVSTDDEVVGGVDTDDEVDAGKGVLEYIVSCAGMVDVMYKGAVSVVVYIGGTLSVGAAVLSVVVSVVLALPVDGSSPNVYNTNTAIIVININGIKMMIHEIMDILFSHNMLSNKVTIIPIHILINAILYNP
jgi:hypothetical protein